jgi:hypothetical protein
MSPAARMHPELWLLQSTARKIHKKLENFYTAQWQIVPCDIGSCRKMDPYHAEEGGSQIFTWSGAVRRLKQ